MSEINDMVRRSISESLKQPHSNAFFSSTTQSANETNNKQKQGNNDERAHQQRKSDALSREINENE
jgi:hypothetical protein